MDGKYEETKQWDESIWKSLRSIHSSLHDLCLSRHRFINSFSFLLHEGVVYDTQLFIPLLNFLPESKTSRSRCSAAQREKPGLKSCGSVMVLGLKLAPWRETELSQKQGALHFKVCIKWRVKDWEWTGLGLTDAKKGLGEVKSRWFMVKHVISWHEVWTLSRRWMLSLLVWQRRAMTEHLLKILVVGDGNVGKTSFVRRYVNGQFNSSYKMTVGGTAACFVTVELFLFSCSQISEKFLIFL